MKFKTLISKQLFNTLFPSKCILCGTLLDEKISITNISTGLTIICSYCQITLPEILTACSKCNTPLNIQSELCGICLNQERYWQQCFSAFVYSSYITDLILLLKHQNNKKLVNYFAQTIIETVGEHTLEAYDFLIPVPMHPIRFAKRGFNQSLELTKMLSIITNIPYINIFSKAKETPKQVSLDKKERENALRNNFLLKHTLSPFIQDKRVALVDDVVTTGATTSELARKLKIAKAGRVDVWSIART